MIMNDSYLFDLREQIENVPEDIFLSTGYSKKDILNNQQLMEHMWAIYQKSIEEYYTTPENAFAEALEDTLHIKFDCIAEDGNPRNIFKTTLDSFTRDTNGHLTNNRFVRMEGMGFKIFITVHESGYIHVTVGKGDEVDYQNLYAPFSPEIIIEYDDLIPTQAIVSFPSIRASSACLGHLAKIITPLTKTVNGVNDILQHLNEI